MTVLENVLLAAPRHPGERLGDDALRAARSGAEREARARADELLALVRLDGHADALAGTLSGGQRKLLDLARALMAEPRLLLLDEPMAGVNPTLRVQLLEHILELRERERVTLLIVEHDLDFVMRASDRVDRDERRPRDRAAARRTRSGATRGRRRVPRGRVRQSTRSRELLEVERSRRATTTRSCSTASRSRRRATRSSRCIGPNGAGKSTLLKAVYGLVALRAGTRALGGRGRHGRARRPADAPRAQLRPADRQRLPDA